jgi:hypothetical protein
MKNLLLIFIVQLISLIGFSQTGPGGVGNAASNILWIKADGNVYRDAGSTLTVNDDLVQQWNDQSGNANNVFQGTSGNRPMYKANIINGKPVLRFDGLDDWMGLNIDVPETNFSQFMVFKTNGSDGNGSVIAITDALTPAAGAHDRQYGLIGNKLGHRLWNEQTITSTADFNDNAAHMATIYVGGSIGGQTIYSDGLSVATGNKSYSDFNWQTTMLIGGHNAWGFLNSDVPEIIYYNVILNTAQRIIVENYLASKYGLNLPVASDKFAYDAAYGNEVAGIGMADATNFHTDAKGSGILRINNASSLDAGDYLLWGHNNASFPASEFLDLPASEGVQGRLRRVWIASETGETGTVDLSFDLTGSGVITASDLRLLIDKTNNGFADETVAAGTIISGATSMGGNVYKFSGIDINNSWSFTLGTINSIQTPLPMELISFTATSTPNKVYLEWETANEINSDYFTIERSNDATNFESIAKVDASEDSLSVRIYSLIDGQLNSGISYYRLKQTDFNGNFFYSPTINVQMDKFENSQIKIYPNPGVNQITIEGEESELNDLKIYDMVGLEVKSITRTNQTNGILMDVSVLPQGLYTIRTKTSTQKVYKQ